MLAVAWFCIVLINSNLPVMAVVAIMVLSGCWEKQCPVSRLMCTVCLPGYRPLYTNKHRVHFNGQAGKITAMRKLITAHYHCCDIQPIWMAGTT